MTTPSWLGRVRLSAWASGALSSAPRAVEAGDDVTILFQARSAKPASRGMLCRQTANFLTCSGTCQSAAAAGGKEHHVARPDAAHIAVLVGDENFARDHVHRLIDRVMPFEAAGRARPRHDREVPSALVASRFERACGLPSMIQCGGIGAGSSSTSAGTAKTTGFDTASSSRDGGALNARTAEKSVNSGRCEPALYRRRTVGGRTPQPNGQSRQVRRSRVRHRQASSAVRPCARLEIRSTFRRRRARRPPWCIASPASSAVLGKSAMSSLRRVRPARARGKPRQAPPPRH